MAGGMNMVLDVFSDIINDEAAFARLCDDMKRYLDHQNMLENIKQDWIKKGRDEILKLFEQGLPIEEIKDWLEA
jgi:hypothetical protein